MNLPGFAAEFSLYGDAVDRYHRELNRGAEQYAVIPQMSLINMLCAEEYLAAGNGVACPLRPVRVIVRMLVQKYLLYLRRPALRSEDVRAMVVGGVTPPPELKAQKRTYLSNRFSSVNR
jgi:hypothetical protein